jgi:hypothetical protein
MHRTGTKLLLDACLPTTLSDAERARHTWNPHPHPMQRADWAQALGLPEHGLPLTLRDRLDHSNPSSATTVTAIDTQHLIACSIDALGLSHTEPNVGVMLMGTEKNSAMYLARVIRKDNGWCIALDTPRLAAACQSGARVQVLLGASPAFLFATLLWHEVLSGAKTLQDKGERPMAALNIAMDEVLARQTDKIAIPRRYTAVMKEIWACQPRYEQRSGRRPFALLASERFRAGYDFLVLRAASGEVDAELAQWWERFQEADEDGRAAMLVAPSSGERKPRRRRRRKSGAAAAEGSSGADEVAGGVAGGDGGGG